MKINRRLLTAVFAVTAAVMAGVFAFIALNENYFFKDEPKPVQKQVNLEKKSLSDRQTLKSEICKEKLGSEVRKQAYETISENVFDMSGDSFTVYGADKNDFQIALNAFLVDHPEAFWIDASSGYKYYEYDNSLQIELNYLETGEALKTAVEKLNAEVDKAAKNAPDNASDYEVELYLNDYIGDRCDYDTEGGMKHNAYGALVEGKAVCDGYSHAFQLLCKRLGIECTVIEGTSDFNSDDEDGHMWNCVLLGGSWYHTDVTWNDSAKSVCGAEHYFYLNLTTEEIERDHIISGEFEDRFNNRGNFFNVYVPECGSDELNYMRLNFVTIKNPDDDDDALAAMIDAAKGKRSYCAFIVDESCDFDSTCKKIVDSCAASWVRGANHFTGGSPKISDDGKVFTYEKQRVLAIQLKYE